MAGLILCAKSIDMETILREYGERHSKRPTSISVCYTEEQLIAALEQADREPGSPAEQRFAIKTQDGVRVVAISEIMYCRCESHRYAAVLCTGEEIISRSFRRSFPNALAPLLESGAFLQCQASYIVNLRFIKTIAEKQLELYSGEKLPFPLSRQERVRRQLGFMPRN